MPRKAKTTDEFQNELNEMYPNTYTVTGKYVNAKTKVKIKYNKCGHENEVHPSNLQDGCGCPICHNLNRLSHEKFVENVNNRYLNKYKILDKYINAETKLSVMYLECGHVATTLPAKLMAGKGCPICHKCTNLTNEEFECRFYELYGDEYELLTKYSNTKTPMEILHKNCGTKFTRIASVLLYKDCLCPLCNTQARIGIIRGINDIHTVKPELEEYLLNSDDAYNYTAYSNKKILWKCPDCGHVFERSINNVVIRGFSCELCGNKTSYGERFVMALFNRLGIDYKTQYSPKWVNQLRYDFYFKIGDDKYIVEVDGSFHFIDNKMSGESVEHIIQKDIEKEMTAKEHGYKIIRLDYYYKNNDKKNHIIKSILNSELSSIFDLATIDFDEIDKIAQGSLLVKISNVWNSSDDKSLYKIINDFKISEFTARNMLYKASDLKLISENRNEIIQINRAHGYEMLGNTPRKVLCIETGEIFNSFSEADKKYNASITNYFREHRKSSGRLPDGTCLTWQEIKEKNVS